MRVTGGTLGGRRLSVPDTGVRPTQDRVREAVFSSLGEYVAGASVVDLFAGSGAYGLESWSRGAERICWVESSRAVLKVLQRNVSELCGGETGGLRVVGSDVWSFVQRGDGNRYSLAFADPPYDHTAEKKQLETLLNALDKGTVLTPDGVLVYEQDVDEPVVSEHPGWQMLRDRHYGKTRILIYRKTNEADGRREGSGG